MADLFTSLVAIQPTTSTVEKPTESTGSTEQVKGGLFASKPVSATGQN